jgi:nucleolar pre-ribosomal-associated protein 1
VAAPSALVQFFQTISGRLDFRDFGLSLCHSLLKRDQLRLFDKALSAPRSKDSLIAINLQLLTEIIAFDEGALASNVFGRRDYLYRRLDGILGNAQSAQGTLLAAHRGALKFLLANLKYLDTPAKTEIITHGKTLYSAIRSLPQEEPEIILETLNAFEQWILEDKALSKQLKGRCFNSGVLTALAKLYDYDHDQQDGRDSNHSQPTVRDSLHQLLLKICTSAKAILLPQTGWYPSGTNPEIVEQVENTIDLGLDSPYYFDDYTEKVPVKNGGLSTFIQGLKPGEDVLHARLTTAVFAAAPELVAEYFSKKQKFLAPSGDDPLWRGQFAFLFSVVQLDVPKNLGWPEHLPSTPPPLSIVIESILPRPLERSITAKCLHSEDEIVVLSTLRFLTIALEKLDSVLKIIDQAAVKSHLWSQAWIKLTNLFVERVPPLQEVITTLQKLETDKEQLRATVLECIAKYHKVLPSAAAALKFDITPLLSKVALRLESEELNESIRDTLHEQLSHQLTIANGSSATKWWHKATAESLSPVVLLLRFCVRSPEATLTKQATPILRDLLTSKGVLSSTTRSLDALLTSLSSTAKWQAEATTYQFLDNCMTRTMQRPVKYLDQIEHLQMLESDKKDLSLVACCVAEQWPFVLKKGDKAAAKNIAGWIARFFVALDSAAENYRVLMHFQKDMLSATEGDEKVKGTLVKAFEKQRKKPVAFDESASSDIVEKAVVLDVVEDTDHLIHTQEALDLDKVFPKLPTIPKSLTGLTRWANPDFESEVQSGRLANLIRCLISPDQEIRLQAFHTLQTVMHAAEQSTYSEKTQVYLLLGEVSETVKGHSLKSSDTQAAGSVAPPSITSELAISVLNVIADPSSPFYQKTNNFLLRGPSWNLSQLIPYWTNETFLTEPESDDAFGPPSSATTNTGTTIGSKNAQHLEISHFLETVLIPSLRTTADLELFRRSQIYTRLFSYYLAPVCPKAIRRQILQVVHVTNQTQGGSDMLITRTGVREWLRVVREIRDHSGHGAGSFGKVDLELSGIVDALLLEVTEKCDRLEIERWEERRPLFKGPGIEGGPPAV